ncbi:MAG: dTDP-4-dehydrorhamnose reductase [Desulfovibrionales bacterium GWA2_65_9]|nr:MAG: dTDP-4-dehydrorhamnose reductase [Desulfovibrionales bacterium GWA2_65_9]
MSLPATHLPKKALVLGGKNGLLGRAVAEALTRAGVETLPVSSADVDYFDADALDDFLDDFQEGHEPDGPDSSPIDCIINAVAYTQVDRAEDQPEEAYRLNASLPALLGVLAEERELRLVHFSTDFVFDGKKGAPYLPLDQPNPLSVYGASKLAGEEALMALDLPGLLILRTAWLFGPGKMNFVQRILELSAERQELKVVADQFGSPTGTADLAKLTVALLKNNATGLLHAANSGQASWHELAAEAVRLAGLSCRVLAIPTSGYPTKAPRPANSVLDITDTVRLAGYTPRHWREALAEYVSSFPTI